MNMEEEVRFNGVFNRKIGKEISFEVHPESTSGGGVTLRTLNDSHSGSGEFHFRSGFFSTFRFPLIPLTHNSTISTLLKFKLYSKTLLNVFRHANFKHLNALTLQIDTQQKEEEQQEKGKIHTIEALRCRFIFDCKYEIQKIHTLAVTDCQILRAVFDKQNTPNKIVAQCFHMTTLLSHIKGTDEVCVMVSPQQVQFHSYYPNGESDAKSHIETETSVSSNEFSSFVFNQGNCAASSQPQDAESVELIFCMKEFKALLAFSEAAGLESISMYFSNGGSPLLVSTDLDSSTDNGPSTFFGQVTLSTVTTFFGNESQSQEQEQDSTQMIQGYATPRKRPYSSRD